MFIYLDRESAKKGISQVLGFSLEKKLKHSEYYNGKSIEYSGDNLPHYITYLSDSDSIREATEEEKLARKQIKLLENQVLINGLITTYDTYTQKVVNNEIINKTREDFIKENIITLESEKNKARQERKINLNAVDLYDKAILRGDISETIKEKEERDIFRNTWLEIPNNYSDINNPIEELYPVPTEKIKYFM